VGRPRNVELDRKIVELLSLGFTYGEVAEKLGISVAAVKSRVHRMRRRGELKPPLRSAWDELINSLLAAKLRVTHVRDELALRHPAMASYIEELTVAAEALRRAVDAASFLRALSVRARR